MYLQKFQFLFFLSVIYHLISENLFQAVFKVTKKMTPTCKHYQWIHCKQCIMPSENSFLTVLNAVRESIPNSLIVISEKTFEEIFQIEHSKMTYIIKTNLTNFCCSEFYWGWSWLFPWGFPWVKGAGGIFAEIS